MAIELGEADFQNYLNSFIPVNSTPLLLRSKESPWWNNIHTTEIETADQIIKSALDKSLAELSDQLGKNSSKWKIQTPTDE